GCYPPSPGTPSYPQPSQPTYNPGTPLYPGSSSMNPQPSQSGWTVPVPNQFSISQSGQVYFHYGSPFSVMQQTVPVSGINPFTTFNGMNGMPHWSSLTMAADTSKLIDRYYGSPTNYSSLYTPSPFSSFGQTQQTPFPVASVYSPTTGIQVGATN